MESPEEKSTMPFDTNRTTLDTGVVLLTLTGTMTMGTQLQRFEWLIDELIKVGQNRVVADMGGISYLDSSAIGVLVGAQGVLKNAGGEFRLAGMADRVSKIFKLAGVDGVLNIDPNRDAALARFANA
jgi:anti-sigma B factor antagonist